MREKENMTKYTVKINKYLSKIKKGYITLDVLRGLYDLTFNHLKIVASVYLCNKDFANDVVAETFQKISDNIDSYDEHQDGYIWLCKMTQKIANSYNSSNTENAAELRIDDIDLPGLNNIDGESKKIFIMYYYLSYSTKEIENKLGKDEATINNSLRDILAKLR